jgi:hypothetical protein
MFAKAGPLRPHENQHARQAAQPTAAPDGRSNRPARAGHLSIEPVELALLGTVPKVLHLTSSVV